MKKIFVAIAIVALLLAGCSSHPKEASKVTETSTSTAPPVVETHTPTDTSTSTVTAPPGTETRTSVVQPTDTVTAPGTTVTETQTP